MFHFWLLSSFQSKGIYFVVLFSFFKADFLYSLEIFAVWEFFSGIFKLSNGSAVSGYGAQDRKWVEYVAKRGRAARTGPSDTQLSKQCRLQQCLPPHSACFCETQDVAHWHTIDPGAEIEELWYDVGYWLLAGFSVDRVLGQFWSWLLLRCRGRFWRETCPGAFVTVIAGDPQH